MNKQATCDYKNGTLPSCAPLAVSFVPMQADSTPQYDKEIALIRGTLFPGLDLPFMNVVNTEVLDTPQAELMALNFVIEELRLYLDTHQDDTEAFELLKGMIELKKEAHERYARRCGPVAFDDVAMFDTYRWTENPWPWTYPGKE